MLDFIMVVLIIIIVALLSGVKVMYSQKYFSAMMPLIIMSGLDPNLNSRLVESYKMGYTNVNDIIVTMIITVAFCIFGYRLRQHSYSIHNIMQVDVVEIIKGFMDDRNIKYEMKKDDVMYLVDFDKSIITSYFISTDLECREVRDTDFYKEFIKYVRAEIKNIKRRYYWIEVVFYVVLLIVCYLLKTGF